MNVFYKKLLSLFLVASVLAVSFGFIAKAAFNEKINYQGKVTDSTGSAIADGSYCMKFVIYDALTDGSALWTETWTASNAKVTTTSGLFSIMLGSHQSLSSLNFNQDSLYLEIQLDVACDGTYEEVFAPRKQMGSVPASFQAKQLGGYTWAVPGTIGSGTPNTGAFTTLSASGTLTVDNNVVNFSDVTDGYILTFNSATNTWAGLAAPASMVYPGAGIAVSTGSAWGTSITDSSTNWNNAYSHKTTEDAINGLVFVNGAGTYSAKAIGTDVQAYDAELAGLAALSYSSGTPFIKMTAAGTFSLDTNTYQTALTNPVTGTGASGQVAYWNGTTTQTGSANLTFDGTGKLTIASGTGGTHLYLKDGDTGTGGGNFGSASATNLFFLGGAYYNSGYYSYATVASGVNFYSGYTYFYNDQNLTAGNTYTPTATLTLGRDNSATFSGAVKVSGLTSGRITYASASGQLVDSANLTFDGNNLLLLDNKKALFGTGSDASIYYDGTDLVINPKEVGTGVIVAKNSININKNGQAASATLDFNADTNYDSIMNFKANNVTLGGFLYDSSASDMIFSNEVVADNADTVFSTSNTERMRIKGTGNVGIGTDAPARKLDINGNGIRFANSGEGMEFLQSSSTAWEIDKIGSTTADLSFNSWTNIVFNSKLGIGTTSPGALLDIGLAGTTLGTLRLEGNTSGYVQLQTAAAAGSWTLTLPANDGDANQFLQTNGSGVTTWATALTSLSGALLADGSVTGATSSAQTFTNGVKTGKIFPASDGTTAVQINKADGTTNVLNVDTTNARVGIGTASPSYALQVNGVAAVGSASAGGDTYVRFQRASGADVHDSITFQEGGGPSLNGTPYVFINRSISGTGGYAMFSSADWASVPTLNLIQAENQDLFAATSYGPGNNGNLFIIKSDGKVGIGTASPDWDLDIVKNDGTGQATIQTTGYGTTPSGWLVSRSARGNVANPAALQSGDSLFNLSARGYNGSAFTTTSKAKMTISTTENWTTTANGTRIDFSTTPNGSTSSVVALSVDQTGYVGILNGAPGALLDIGTAGTTLGTMRLEGNTSGYVQIQPAAAAGGWTLTLPTNDGDNGQALITNGSGVTSWSTVLTSLSGALLADGSVTGATSSAQAFTNGVKTGKIFPASDGTTAFQINKADGTTNVLNVDTTNGRVGVGTTSPNAAFEVSGTAGTHLRINAAAGNHPGLEMAVADTLKGYFWYDNTNSLLMVGPGTYGVGLGVNSSGKVGIGTTSPSATLHVDGSQTGDATNQAGLKITNTITGTNSYDVVGIGAQGLYIAPTVNNATNYNGIFSIPQLANAAVTVTNVNAINTYTGYGYNAGASVTSATGLRVKSWGNTAPGTFTNQYGIYVEAMTGATNNYAAIFAGGNVGIGTTAPGALLDIGKAGTTLGTLRLEGNTSGYVQLQTAAAAGSWTMTLPANDGDNGQVLTTNGSGVTSWATALTSLSGALLADGSVTGATSQIQIFTNGVQASAINGGAAANDDITIQGTSDGTRTTSYVNLQPNGGNVGIGTAVPSQKLSVAGNVIIGTEGGTRIAVTGAGGTVALGEYYSSETVPRWSLGRDAVGNGVSGLVMWNSSYTAGGTLAQEGVGIGAAGNAIRSLALYVSNGTALTEEVRVNGTGVGIKNINPGALLDIGTAGTTLGTMRLEGNTSGYVQIQPAAAAGSWTLTLPANDGDNGQVLTTNGSGVTSWAAASGANTALSNLASVAINTSLISDTDSTDDLGSSSKYWANTYTDSIIMAPTSSSTVGVIFKGANRFIHDYDPPTNGGAVDPDGNNTFIGVNAGNFTMGSTATVTAHSSDNVGVGYSALTANTTGYTNVAIGSEAFLDNTTGYQGTAVGAFALWRNTTGFGNVAVGYSTLLVNTEGEQNTALGYAALGENFTGNYNSAVGTYALFWNYDGSNNNAIGLNAGAYLANGTSHNSTPDYSLYLGDNTKASVANGQNEIVIGYDATGLGSNSVVLGNSSITTTALRGNVGIGSTAPQSLLEARGPAGTGTASASVLTLATAETTIVDGDQLGRIDFNAPLEADGSDSILVGASIWAEADATFSTTVNSTELVFATGTTTAALEKMRITSDGRVGIGTSTPGYTLDLVGSMQLQDTASIATGVIYKNGVSFLHNFDPPTNGGGYDPVGYNTFLGLGAGNFTMGSTATSTSDSSRNTGIGYNALTALTLGRENTAVGYGALKANQSGIRNIAIGDGALDSNTSGGHNVAIGNSALSFNSTNSSYNVGVGYTALYQTTGSYNIGIGAGALNRNTSGDHNIAIGTSAGIYIADGATDNTTSDYSVYIGESTKALADNDQNEIVIGYNATGIGSNTAVLGNSSIVTTALRGNVGVGNTAPQSLLEVRGPTGTGTTGSGVLTLATAETTIVDGDQLGRIDFNAPLEADGSDSILVGASIWAEADDTFSTTVNSTELVFATGTTAAATEKMRIDSAGNVGIGTSTPQTALNVVGTIRLSDSDGTSNIWNIARSGADLMFGDNTTWRVYFQNNGEVGIGVADPTDELHVVGNVYATAGFHVGADSTNNLIDDASNGSGSSTLYVGNKYIYTVAVSDRKTKENIVDTQYGLADLMKLSVKDYKYKKQYVDEGAQQKEHTGMIAQEVEAVYPEAVVTRSDDLKAIDFPALIPLIIQSIQDLNNKSEIISSETGQWADGEVPPIKASSVQTALKYFGMSLEKGIATLQGVKTASLTAETASVEVVKIKKMEMVDDVTGETYCTWISNGEWKKVKGECVVTLASASSSATEGASQTTEQAANSTQAESEAQPEAVTETQPVTTQEAETEQTAPENASGSSDLFSPVSEAILNGSSGLLIAMWNFIKWIFVSLSDKIFQILK